FQAGTVSFPSPERAHHQWRELSDGGAFRPRQPCRHPRGDRRADDGRQAQQIVQQHRAHHAESGGPAGQGGSRDRPHSVPPPNPFLPVKRNYFPYEGSLPTPPCPHTVNWFVLTDPVQVAEADINSFARLYSKNARPVQKDNRRFVLRSI